MHITPPLTSIPTLLPLLLLILHLPVQTSATPHPQLIAPTMLDEPSSGAQQCRDMEAAMNDCFGGAPYMLKGLALDEAAMRACVCASGGFTAATVTLCTGDSKAYAELCGDGEGEGEGGRGER